MQKLDFWVPSQEPKWHTPVRPSIHLPPPPPSSWSHRGVISRKFLVKSRNQNIFQYLK